MLPEARAFSKLPPDSLGVSAIMSSPRSIAASPRVIGLATSVRCLSGAISISIAVTNATKPPTDVLLSALCTSATVITADKATEASNCVSGVMAADAAVDFNDRRRSESLRC